MKPNQTIPLLLFAKAPVAGQVKTRLQSHCGPKQAAEIARLLLEASLKTVCSHWSGPVYLSTWLDFEHPALLDLSRQYNVEIHRQCEGDLGTKMQGAFDELGYPLAIMGSDAPHVADETLQQLFDLLKRGESAIAPSDDGGYYLIGLHQPTPFLFEDMQWGTNEVLRVTRERVKSNNHSIKELASLQDIDEWPDLLSALDALPLVKHYLKAEALI